MAAQNNNLMISVEDFLIKNKRLLADCQNKILVVRGRLNLLELIACDLSEDNVELSQLTQEEELLVKNNQSFFENTILMLQGCSLERKTDYLMNEIHRLSDELHHLMVEKNWLMDRENNLKSLFN